MSVDNRSKQLTEHFREEEFRCNCGCKTVSMDQRFLEKLEYARVLAKIPFRINSGYRCSEYNAQVGGVDSSAHTEGKAVDIQCRDSRSRFIIIDSLRQAGIHRIGIAKTFIHADFDLSKPPMVAWLY